MSLDFFHIVFIATSVLLAFGFGTWAGIQFAAGGGAGMAVLGLLSAAAGVGLIVYGRAFRKKIKALPSARHSTR